MNDRMTELYAAACLYARDQQLDLEDKNVPAFVECMAEKFAELLIQEFAYDCIDVTNQGERILLVAKKWGIPDEII